MKTIIFYPLQGSIIYSMEGNAGKKQGIIPEKDIEQFLAENPPRVMNVLLPKPDILFRKLEFPFTGKRNIKLVLPGELENILPETEENYHYSFEFHTSGKNRSTVNVYALKNTRYDFWKKLALKYNSKILFFSDMLIFNLFISRYTSEKNYVSIYGIQNYILINLIQDGILMGSYSYSLEKPTSPETKELLSNILSSRKLFRIFVFAEENIRQNIDVPDKSIEDVESMKDSEKAFLFHNLLATKVYKKPLQFKKLHQVRKIPVYSTVMLSVFIIGIALSASPYFRISSREKRINALNRKMEETFMATCPEVTKIVDPLAQIKGKIKEQEKVSTVVSGYPSILQIMADITVLFPKNADASIEQFNVAGNTLTISGDTGSLSSLEKIKEHIEKSQKFTVKNMGLISFNTRNRVNFDITLGIKKHE